MVPAGCGLSAGSHAAPRQWLARRIARWTAWCARRLARRHMWFETGPTACQMACLCIASADGSRQVRCLAQRLAHSGSAEDWIPDGSAGLHVGSLAVLRRRIRFQTGPASCPTARSRCFGGWFEMGLASCPTACSRRFGGWFSRDGPGVLPGSSRDYYFMHQQKIKFLRELRELEKLTGAPGVKYNFVLR